MHKPKKKILFVFGTRPEALKLAPVIRAAKKCPGIKTLVCITGQHREMLWQVLKLFKIKPDFDLDLMTTGQTLGELTSRIFPKIKAVIHQAKPDLIVVQGDTTSAFATALKAFYERIPVAHVEAGLRTNDKYQPFPEEINRVLVSHLADLHFAPTKEARTNLLREGVPANRIFFTGNTIVDTLTSVKPLLGRFWPSTLSKAVTKKRIVLVTAHRRENFGAPLNSICFALRKLADNFPDVEIVYPVHPNPHVRKTAHDELGGRKRITLLEPLTYFEFLSVMASAHLVITDSGGIQEEAPSFKKPVLVMRNVSERPDGIKLGVAKLVGTSEKRIFREATRLLGDARAYQRMKKNGNPYGDGKASARIVRLMVDFLTRKRA